jgi:hypothetical protein
MTALLSQLAAPASGAIETWLLSAAAVASMALLVKKLFLTKTPREPEFLTKIEFYQEMTQVREKIERGFLTTRETIDQAKGYLALTAERQVDSIHRRLIGLEEAVARLDERTKK